MPSRYIGQIAPVNIAGDLRAPGKNARRMVAGKPCRLKQRSVAGLAEGRSAQHRVISGAPGAQSGASPKTIFELSASFLQSPTQRSQRGLQTGCSLCASVPEPQSQVPPEEAFENGHTGALFGQFSHLRHHPKTRTGE